ncbi:MAG: helicase-associated domain-containing protein [Firmicutes bacterium]|nr:helicase-associated domain-containing protein [Bacillota bacterium]
MNPQFQSIGEILGHLTADDLAQLAAMLKTSGTSPEELALALLHPQRIEAMLEDASADLRAALGYWIANRGVWTHAQRDARIAHGMQELAAWGYCFAVHYGPYPSVPVTPWELLPRLLPKLWDLPWERLTVKASPRSSEVAPLWTPLTHDLFVVLSYARREPLLLTTHGEVYQRIRNKLEKLLWPRPEVNPGATLQYLIGLLQRVDLLWVQDEPYSLEVSANAEALLDLPPWRFFQWLGQYWFDPLHTVWPQLIWVSLLSLIAPDQALKLPDTLQWLKSHGWSGVANQHSLQYALSELAVFDLLDLKSSAEAMRLSDWAYDAMNGRFEAPEPRQIIVQPNGDILVPPQVPLGERWALDGLATRAKSERVMIYRLDAQAVKYGIQRGLTAAEHLKALEALTAYPIPDNVRANLEDWYRQYGRHRIVEATLIHSQSPDDSANVERLLGGDALGRLSPTDIVIRADRVKEVLKSLEKAGQPMLPDVARPSEAAASVHLRTSRIRDEETAWSFSLWRRSEKPSSAHETLKKQLSDAIRRGTGVRLTYRVDNRGSTQTETVVPVMAETDWIQVYLVNERRYITLPWHVIVACD